MAVCFKLQGDWLRSDSYAESPQLKRLANKRAPPWLFLHEYTVKPPLVRAEAGRINDALNYLALPSLIRVKQLFLLILVDFSMA